MARRKGLEERNPVCGEVAGVLGGGGPGQTSIGGGTNAIAGGGGRGSYGGRAHSRSIRDCIKPDQTNTLHKGGLTDEMWRNGGGGGKR